MKSVVLYGTSATGFLETKKSISNIQGLLEAKGVPYTYVDCSVETDKRDHMYSISGKRVVPQVFVNDKYIGVCNFFFG